MVTAVIGVESITVIYMFFTVCIFVKQASWYLFFKVEKVIYIYIFFLFCFWVSGTGQNLSQTMKETMKTVQKYDIMIHKTTGMTYRVTLENTGSVKYVSKTNQNSGDNVKKFPLFQQHRTNTVLNRLLYKNSGTLKACSHLTTVQPMLSASSLSESEKIVKCVLRKNSSLKS